MIIKTPILIHILILCESTIYSIRYKTFTVYLIKREIQKNHVCTFSIVIVVKYL